MKFSVYKKRKLAHTILDFSDSEEDGGDCCYSFETDLKTLYCLMSTMLYSPVENMEGSALKWLIYLVCLCTSRELQL